MIDVKILDDGDCRSAHSLFRAAMHVGPAEDAMWEHARLSYLPGRTLGAYAGGTLIGTTMSLPMPMRVPGGALLASAAVTRVGVRADQTRRGALTAVMREQLTALAAAGEPLASLRASEYPIYGRFGYGVASRGRTVELDPRRARLHPGAPVTGQVRMLAPHEPLVVLPPLHRRVGAHRPGGLARTDDWWQLMLSRPSSSEHPLVTAVHTGPGGDDGYVQYRAERNVTAADPEGLMLVVHDLHAATVEATTGLWRFVLGVDLVNLVRGWLRPLDEPLELLLADARVCRTTEVSDETWLRLVDVPAALAARSWAGDRPVMLAVHDALLPANSGCYRITPEGVCRVDEPAQLECDVAVLGRLYLGDVAPSALAATGWLRVHESSALAAADGLFATGTLPWSGTFF